MITSEKFTSISKDSLFEEIFSTLNSGAIEALSESKTLALIKAAQVLGYRHYRDIPEESDDAVKLEKISQGILDKEKGNQMNHLEKIKGLIGEERKNALFRVLDNKAIDALSNFQLSEGVRKVGDYAQGRHNATIHKDSDTGEYRVKFHTDGKHLIDADYFDDDKESAMGTAKHQINGLHSKDSK